MSSMSSPIVTRGGLYLIPTLSVIAIGAITLCVSRPRPVVGARIFGGPTESKRLSWRIEVSEQRGRIDNPAPLGPITVTATLPDGRSKSVRAEVDQEGETSVLLEFGAPSSPGSISVLVTSNRYPRDLARGKVWLDLETWKSRARWQGGWIRGHATGDLAVRATVALGVLAVAMRAPVWIEVLDHGYPVEGAELELRPEGMALVSAGPWRTDRRGRSEVMVEPQEHVVALGVEARTRDGRRASWYATLPVVAGALAASRTSSILELRSNIEASRAYWAILTERERWAGGVASLANDGRGGGVARVALPELPREPWWAVVSRHPTFDSPATVGWPLGVSVLPEKGMQSFSVPDRLLLDGVAQAEQNERSRRRRLGLLGLAVAAAAASLVVLLIARRVRAAELELQTHLGRLESADHCRIGRTATRSTLAVIVAAGCITLGFLVVALALVLRLLTAP